MNLEEIIGLFLTPLIIFGFGWYWTKYPPKKINYLYGYRTRRSMANQNIWEYANSVGAKMMIYLGIICFAISMMLYFLEIKWKILISMFVLLLGLGFGMYWCETMINKFFDKNGNQKPNVKHP